MKLEVLLSTMNLNKEDLDKMHITTKCTVINQCAKEDKEEYKNFTIYSYNEKGLSNSRNRGLDKVEEEIILLCDDDVIYSETYEIDVLEEFKKYPNADVIAFNMDSPNRKMKINFKNKKLHNYNVLRYSSYRIAFKKSSIEKNNIRFNPLFGAGAKYSNGEDALFLVDCLSHNLNIYSSVKNLGKVYHDKSTWFDGYDEKFFYDKGALFTALNKKLRTILIIQYLLRHKEVFEKIKFIEAYKIMKKGSNDYIKNYS